jgi:NADPH2:quinone reductase
MTQNVRAVTISEHGGPEAMRWETIDLPEPGPGQARVRHTAVGLNMIDTYHRRGIYPLPSFPHGLGVEAAGVVEALGDASIAGLEVGQRVAYTTSTPGCYAEARNVTTDRLVPLPDDVTDEQAACALLKGLTVEYLIRRCFRVEPSTTVLFHAAAGGVGLIACQWLAALGATVIGTVSTPEKAELARAQGCHHPVVYTEEDFLERVTELTGGEGVPVVYDSVGKDTFMRSLDCLRRRGTLVAFGNASGKPDPFDPLLLSRKGSLFLTRPTLFDYTATREELLAGAEALFQVLRSGQVRVEARQRFPLKEAAAAHRALEARKTTGSTVLLP